MLSKQVDVFQVKERRETRGWFESQTTSIQIEFLLAAAVLRIETIQIEFRVLRGTHSESLEKEVLARVLEPLTKFALAVESGCDTDVFLGQALNFLGKIGTTRPDKCHRAAGAGRPATLDRSATRDMFGGVAE